MINQNDLKLLEFIKSNDPETYKLIRKINNSYSESTSSMAHEARNTTTLIYSTAQLLEFQHPELTSYNLWNQLYQDICTLSSQLTNISSYISYKSLQMEFVNISNFIYLVYNDMLASFQWKSEHIRLEIGPDLPRCKLDCAKMWQAIYFIFKHIDFVSTPKTELEFQADRENDNVVITIGDNNAYITPENNKCIFTPYSSGNSETGMLLPSSYEIILLHNGSISLMHKPDKGNIFKILLPAYDADNIRIQISDQAF